VVDSSNEAPASRWTFLTNHGHVLIAIAQDAGVRVRDIADRVGITERSAQGIVRDLVDGGYIERARVGRRNRYTVLDDLPLRHPIEQEHMVGELIETLTRTPPRPANRSTAS
jgi:hypothetical protein